MKFQLKIIWDTGQFAAICMSIAALCAKSPRPRERWKLTKRYGRRRAFDSSYHHLNEKVTNNLRASSSASCVFTAINYCTSNTLGASHQRADFRTRGSGWPGISCKRNSNSDDEFLPSGSTNRIWSCDERTSLSPEPSVPSLECEVQASLAHAKLSARWLCILVYYTYHERASKSLCAHTIIIY